MTERKTLLNKYGIPLNHLDFAYVKECDDAREMEKIVHILQSGEEGYYPDLTRCAEDKLRLLKPNSRLFRCETQLLRGGEVGDSESQPIKEFSRTVRARDKQLTALKSEDDNLPPVRTPCKISINKNEEQKDGTISNAGSAEQNKKSGEGQKSTKKTSATDYRKWDRYDPDEEILRMDLAEERQQEEVEIKTRVNEKTFSKPLIEEIKRDEEVLRKLTDIERDSLAEEYRLRGNEYFRAKEYDFALAEYTRTIQLNPEKDAAAYNNRAITNIKLKKFSDAIQDCLKCLSIEPKNVKAMYRLGQSYMESDCKEKALEMFNKVLKEDPSHTNAKNFVKTLSPQVVPSNATRLRIEEVSTEVKTAPKKKEAKKTVPKKSSVSEVEKDYDLASLVRPKEIVPNSWAGAAASLMGKGPIPNVQKNDQKAAGDIKTTSDQTSHENEMQLRLPIFNETAKRNKPLIEEL